jgi:hypothetical protein
MKAFKNISRVVYALANDTLAIGSQRLVVPWSRAIVEDSFAPPDVVGTWYILGSIHIECGASWGPYQIGSDSASANTHSAYLTHSKQPKFDEPRLSILVMALSFII